MSSFTESVVEQAALAWLKSVGWSLRHGAALVVTWLDVHDVRYTPKVKFTGKTGFDHLFDFVIPKSVESARERAGGTCRVSVSAFTESAMYITNCGGCGVQQEGTENRPLFKRLRAWPS